MVSERKFMDRIRDICLCQSFHAVLPYKRGSVQRWIVAKSDSERGINAKASCVSVI